ncbi:MAG TPA: ATP-binding cassette domain-containing protein [Ktedonobacteraceae bacterium]|nr:ATP-binding cassette domain-containing protein [Ktedonobacteraceae bacterium]
MLNVNLQHRLGNFHLSVDFSVPLNLTVLFGFSGAGKSLTLRSLAGLLRPEHGYISIDGQVLFDSASGIDLPPQERRVGYVPQHYALFPHLTISENILFALPRQAHWPGSRKIYTSQKARVNELLAALELEGLERRYPATLSGGQQQRVALARALMAEPRLLLLDEPFNALDVSVRERLRDTLKRFQRHFAVPILLVTHDHTEVQQLADQVVVLQQGQVAQVGSIQEIFLSPATSTVARLVGQDNLFSGYPATPPQDSPNSPSEAIHLNCLQSNASPQPAESLRFHEPRRGRLIAPTADLSAPAGSLPPSSTTDSSTPWLPLPPTLSSPISESSSTASSGAISQEPHPGRDQSGPYTPPVIVPTDASPSSITGCIRNDEVRVHRWSGSGIPPIWNERGAAQWLAELVEAQIQGPAMRLLVRPQWIDSSADDNVAEDELLKIYLSRSQWREVEVMPGELLLLEVGPEAVHLFTK